MQWIGVRWQIMLKLFKNDVNFDDIETDDQYEKSYLIFLHDLFTFIDRSTYSSNVINGFCESLSNDFKALLFYDDNVLRFYDLKKFSLPITNETRQSVIKSISNKINAVREKTSSVLYNTNGYENLLKSYMNGSSIMSDKIIYSREIGLHNPNITAIYLFEVHLSNYRMSVQSPSNVEVINTFLNFLLMHLGEDNSVKTIYQSMQNLIKLLMQYSPLYGPNIKTLFELEEKSENAIGMSIFRLASIVIASGVLPISKELISEDVMKSHSSLVNDMRSFYALREYNPHLIHVFDIARLQLSPHLINKFTAKTIIDYKLLSPSLNAIDQAIEFLSYGKHQEKKESIISQLKLQQYVISLAKNERALLYRTRLIHLLISLM